MLTNNKIFMEAVAKIALKKIFLFMLLLTLVLLVNFSVLSYDMMYVEQPILYLVNQKIHSWHDLLAVYLHPQMLDTVFIPFFRPSGHFLIYQLVAPLLGWHNTRGLLVVNFIFLTLMGCMMVKLYKLLFPRYQLGGYIAFAICLMHPVFLLSRFTPMHFEYASIFFLLSSLCCFIIFCQENKLEQMAASVQTLQVKKYFWLVMTVLLYLIAVTFKETTIMLMPALVCYLLLILYSSPSPANFFRRIARNKQILQLIIMLMLVAASIAGYLSLAWAGGDHPPFEQVKLTTISNAINMFFKMLFGYPYNIIPGAIPRTDNNLWGSSIFPLAGGMLMLAAMFMLPLTAYRVFSARAADSLSLLKTPILFLYCCVTIFLFLPVIWGHVMPWHAGVSLIFLSLLIGFSFEVFIHKRFLTITGRHIAGYGLAAVIAIMTITTNQQKISFLNSNPLAMNMVIDRNAVLFPPSLMSKLNNDSVIVVESSLVRSDDYMLGDSVYPYVHLNIADIHRARKNIAEYRYPYVYGGTLFRWAYLNPAIKEQVYPFRVEQMKMIPDEEVIYNWLQHYDNIFCLGFDSNGVWHDKTVAFKENLLKEKLARHMVVNSYCGTAHIALTGLVLKTIKFPSPDSMECKQQCDRDKACAGFTYFNAEKNHESISVCKFYQTVAANKTNCVNCAGFLKV
jgi:hypothetical protein